MMKNVNVVMPDGCDKYNMSKAVEMANTVDFLNEEEFKQYVLAVYNAMMWGERIGRENRKLKGGR